MSITITVIIMFVIMIVNYLYFLGRLRQRLPKQSTLALFRGWQRRVRASSGTCSYIYIYIYTYREREREIDLI